MTASMFSRVDSGTIIMIVLAIAIAVYLYVLERKSKKSKDDPCLTYAVLTEDTLAALDDGEVLRAVAANLTAKQTAQTPDLSLLLPLLSPGRCGVYSVWLLCHELDTRSLSAYFRTPYRRFAPFAADGFALIGADACAAAMEAACDWYEAKKNGDKDRPSPDDLTAELRRAIEQEQPLSLCVQYIRAFPAEFVDSQGNIEQGE